MNKKAEVYAKHNNAQISPKKVAPVLNLVRGKGVEEAKVILSFDRTKAARLTLKVLNSASANAKNNLNIDPNSMYLSDLYVDPGKMGKRWRPAARGRISPILKRSCHITVGLSSLPEITATKPLKKEEKVAKKPVKKDKEEKKVIKKKPVAKKATKSKVKKEEKK